MSAPMHEAAPTPATPAPETVDVHRLGDSLVCRLKSALGRHGIVLPSLVADHPVGNNPLIFLGRANQETVEKLTALLDSVPPTGGA
ncbi:hypothetical protein ABH931_007143 [Streptacidiphilus sp. MAP12-33]|uniref:hypothetical protein n=1 Tax=Streptacidiphilus sp. MAP12-33 TaxID=3156266 RepID=UPI0035190275